MVSARKSSSQGNLLRESSIGLELSRLHRISLGVITADEFGISFGDMVDKRSTYLPYMQSVFLIRDTIDLDSMHLYTIRNEMVRHVIEFKEKEIRNLRWARNVQLSENLII